MRFRSIAFSAVLTLMCMTGPARAESLLLNTEEYPPMNFLDPDSGKIIGIGTDLVREVMRRADVSYEIRILPWQRAYNETLNEKDVCVFSTTHTMERNSLFQWVGPLSIREWSIYSLASEALEIHSFQELRKYVVGGYAGDAKAVKLQGLGVQMDLAVKDDLNPKKLEAGRIKLWAADAEMAPILAAQAGVEIRKLFTFDIVPMSLACNRAVAPDLINRLAAALKNAYEDGTVDRITARYR